MDNQILDALRPVPLFQAFSDQDDRLALVASLMTERRVAGGELVIREGELGDELFILKRGEVEVSRTTLDDEQYTVAILRDQDHPFFGEMALLDEDKRSASIRAIQDCEVLVLQRKHFEELGDSHPDLGLNIMRELSKIVSRRLRAANQDVILLFEALVNEVQSEEIG